VDEIDRQATTKEKETPEDLAYMIGRRSCSMMLGWTLDKIQFAVSSKKEVLEEGRQVLS
jgi:hypothetical protein